MATFSPWAKLQIPPQCLKYEGVSTGDSNFVGWMGTFNLAAPLMVFEKSRLMPAEGLFFTSNASLIHYTTIQHIHSSLTFSRIFS